MLMIQYAFDGDREDKRLSMLGWQRQWEGDGGQPSEGVLRCGLVVGY